jgi:hypothetical protein
MFLWEFYVFYQQDRKQEWAFLKKRTTRLLFPAASTIKAMAGTYPQR